MCEDYHEVRSTIKRRRGSGNTYKLNRFKQDMKTRTGTTRSMKTKRSKSKSYRRSWNTKKSMYSSKR